MSVYVPADIRRKVRTHFSDTCAYCHTSESLTVTIFEIEHILPQAAGGETVYENLCLACPSCNRYKSDRTTGKNHVRLFHPQQDAWPEHFDWSVEEQLWLACPKLDERLSRLSESIDLK